MLLNLRIVIGHLPDQWIAQSRYDDLSNITTIVIDDRRIPEGQTIETIIAHEVGHARAAYKHRERYAASTKAERDAAYNTAQDYIINEMLKPSTSIPGTFERKRFRTDGKFIRPPWMGTPEQIAREEAAAAKHRESLRDLFAALPKADDDADYQ